MGNNSHESVKTGGGRTTGLFLQTHGHLSPLRALSAVRARLVGQLQQLYSIGYLLTEMGR